MDFFTSNVTEVASIARRTMFGLICFVGSSSRRWTALGSASIAIIIVITMIVIVTLNITCNHRAAAKVIQMLLAQMYVAKVMCAQVASITTSGADIMGRAPK